MDVLHSDLPRMKASRELYPSNKVEFLVAEVYTKVMHFLRDSVKYYQRSGYRTSALLSQPLILELTRG